MDCKTCVHGTILYRRDKDDRYSAAYTPLGRVLCRGPRYKGREYVVKDSRKACREFEPKRSAK